MILLPMQHTGQKADWIAVSVLMHIYNHEAVLLFDCMTCMNDALELVQQCPYSLLVMVHDLIMDLPFQL